MSRLVVFCLGWGCDPLVACNQLPDLGAGWGDAVPAPGQIAEGYPGGADVMWLYDWRRMPSPIALRAKVEAYDERYLVAWSFGVWAAERLFGASAGSGAEAVGFTRAVALNGTPLPADERLGMGMKRLRLTLRGLPARGTDEFMRRAYGPQYDQLLPVLDPRGQGEDIRELRALIEESEKPYTPSLSWDEAVVGSDDVIFPPAAMRAYWGARAKVLPLPHFPFGEPGLTRELLGL